MTKPNMKDLKQLKLDHEAMDAIRVHAITVTTTNNPNNKEKFFSYCDVSYPIILKYDKDPANAILKVKKELNKQRKK